MLNLLAESNPSHIKYVKTLRKFKFNPEFVNYLITSNAIDYSFFISNYFYLNMLSADKDGNITLIFNYVDKNNLIGCCWMAFKKTKLKNIIEFI